jgi:lipid-A-disaccharide synthase
MNVAVVAGEASGDRQAANLLRELSVMLAPGETVDAWGIGGPHLAAAGCDLLADSRSWGTIGVINSLSQPATLLFAMRKFKILFKQRTPDLLILVDFGAFNIPLAKWVKSLPSRPIKSGANARNSKFWVCPIFYYFPPSSWRRKIGIAKLKKLTTVSDLIITPFSWSEEILRSAGGNAYFVGHPLLDTVRRTMNVEEFDDLYGIDNKKTVITLLPGSREHEVKYILPVMLSAAGEIAARIPGAQFLVARSPNLSRKLIEDILFNAQQQGTSASLLHLAQHAGDLIKHASSALKPQISDRVSSLATPEGLLVKSVDPNSPTSDWAEKRMTKRSQSAPLAIVENATHDALARADLVIAASGTATLEAAILGSPQIIVYLGSSLMNLEYKLRRKALNITYICPEFLQENANPGAIANKAVEMLLQPEKLMQAKSQMQELVMNNLGEPGATKRVANMLIEFLNVDRGTVSRNASGAN